MGEVTNQRLLGLDNYIAYFSDNRPASPNNVRVAANYIRVVENEVRSQFGQLEGDAERIDTALEWVLASYYSPVVVQIRPPEADTILPANNPRLAGLKLGAALYQDIQVLRFLASTGSATADNNAVGRYEGMLRFVCDRNGVTRAEIEQYYRNGIRGFIAGIVSEEFNKVSFSMSNDAIRKGYNAVLTRTANNQYILEYTGVYQGQPFNETLPPQTLDALLATMRRDTYNFDQAGVNTVSAQAALIPAVVYAGWKARGIAGGVDALDLITETLTNFYLDPNRSTYEPILGIYARINSVISAGRDEFANVVYYSLTRTLTELAPALQTQTYADIRSASQAAYLRVPNDPRYDIFAVRYSPGR